MSSAPAASRRYMRQMNPYTFSCGGSVWRRLRTSSSLTPELLNAIGSTLGFILGSWSRFLLRALRTFRARGLGRGDGQLDEQDVFRARIELDPPACQMLAHDICRRVLFHPEEVRCAVQLALGQNELLDRDDVVAVPFDLRFLEIQAVALADRVDDEVVR